MGNCGTARQQERIGGGHDGRNNSSHGEPANKGRKQILHHFEKYLICVLQVGKGDFPHRHNDHHRRENHNAVDHHGDIKRQPRPLGILRRKNAHHNVGDYRNGRRPDDEEAEIAPQRLVPHLPQFGRLCRRLGDNGGRSAVLSHHSEGGSENHHKHERPLNDVSPGDGQHAADGDIEDKHRRRKCYCLLVRNAKKGFCGDSRRLHLGHDVDRKTDNDEERDKNPDNGMGISESEKIGDGKLAEVPERFRHEDGR